MKVDGRPGDLAERRLHPAYLIISAGESLRALLPVVIGISVWRTHWWVLAIAGALLVALALAGWWTRKYAVTNGVLRVRTGLFARSVHSIPASRITALDAHRGVVQRLFRVWGLKVQTPGDGDRASVRLSCLSVSALEELRSALDPARRAPGPATALESSPAAGETVIARLGLRDLLIAAITGTSIPLLFLGAAAAWNRLRDLLPEHTLRTITREVFGGSWWLIASGILLAVLVGVVIVALRLAAFTVTREGDRLRVTRGLLAQRAGTVTVDRIQAVRVIEGFWRRPLGYCALEVEVAGLSGRKDNERLLFPLLRTAEVAAFVARALPELGWPQTPPTPVPARARRRYLTVPLLVAAAITVGLLMLPGRWATLAIAPLPLAGLVGVGQFRDAGWQTSPDTTTFRWRRVLARHTVVARTRRVQLTSVSANPWQRRAGLAGIRITLSSKRKAGIRHLDGADADHLLHAVGRRPEHVRLIR